jgi:hypothetical protein
MFQNLNNYLNMLFIIFIIYEYKNLLWFIKTMQKIFQDQEKEWSKKNNKEELMNR